MNESDRTLDGLNAKYRRARTLLDGALACTDRTSRFDKLVSAIEPAVGIPEQITQARQGRFREIRIGKSELRRHLIGELPHLELLEKLRIHDFHRAGLTAPAGTTTIHGEIRLEARGPGGFAQHGLTWPDNKPITRHSAGGSVTLDNKMVYQHEDTFLDETMGQYFSLEVLLSEFLEKAPVVIEWFRSERIRSRG